MYYQGRQTGLKIASAMSGVGQIWASNLAGHVLWGRAINEINPRKFGADLSPELPLRRVLSPGKAQGRKTGSAHALGALPSLAPLCIMYNFKNICFKICNFLLCLSCVSNKYDCGRGKYKKLCEGPRRISLDIRKSWRNIWSVSLWLFSKISFSQDFSGVKKKFILFSMNWQFLFLKLQLLKYSSSHK